MELLNGKYKIESDNTSFTLSRRYETKDKDGNPVTREAQTFHATFKSCLVKILDSEAIGCKSIEEVLKRYEILRQQIIRM